MTQAKTQAEMASLLSADGFAQNAPAESCSDPVAVISMVVTLDQLRPYEFNPRKRRNPLYDEIKCSIKEQGLVIPPGITRRPGQEHYIIRNGGNTRLSILRELWGETREERFFRIHCQFHPWTARGDIEALTAHLTENELRSGLTFIERALAVQQAQQLYEELEPEELCQPMSQSELARRLKADGYPVTQPHISRMQEAVAYLLPVIPNTLFAGLGRPQIEKLSALRRVAHKVWMARHADQPHESDTFIALFQEVLSKFDTGVAGFEVDRIRDELTGRMADALGIRYETFAAELFIFEDSLQKPGQPQPLKEIEPPPVEDPAPVKPAATVPKAESTEIPGGGQETSPPQARQAPELPAPQRAAPATERLHDLQERLSAPAPQGGATPPQVATGPAHADGLYPSRDIWTIAPELDAPKYLRIHIASFAQEIAHEAKINDGIEECPHGIGFHCGVPDCHDNPQASAALALLGALSVPYLPNKTGIDAFGLAEGLGRLLLGQPKPEWGLPQGQGIRLSDSGLVALFRLIRLSRRLLESTPDDEACGGFTSDNE